MSGKTKGIIVFTFGVLALVAGNYFAGWMTLWLLKQPSPLAATTYYQYLGVLGDRAWAPYVMKIKVSGVIGFGLPLLLWLGVLYLMFRSKERSLYGESRFARAGDLAKQDALKDDPNGIIACRFGGRFIYVSKSKHLLLAAATRSGKGVSVVIPNCLKWAKSLVMLDVKQEAYEKSAGHRATLGPVYLFDPFSETKRSHRWNPLTYVSLDPTQRNSDITAIAASLYKETGASDPFWAEMSKSTFIAVCEFLFDRYMLYKQLDPTSRPTLGEVYRILSGDGIGANETKQAFFRRLAEAPFAGEKARMGLLNLVNLAEQTFSSAVATTLAPLNIFGNPVVDAATSGDDFDLRNLRRQVQSIYVGVAPSKLIEAKGVLNLFFEQAIKLNGSVLPEHDKTLKVQCLFLLDEFTALGRVDIIPVAVGWAAGYGMRFVIVIQSISQLEAVYGAETARGLVTNLGAQIIYAPREQRDADEYSKMLGETTVKRRQYSRSQGQGGGRSYTEIIDRRALMNPDEIKALDDKKAIVMIEGVGFPILANKIFYYRDPYFKKRLLPAPQVPTLTLTALSK
ncbi:type IV secretory system conjugative DNA transfer family protein [Rhodanobacter sp. Col0626]|uniref:type IV secretory system conjugative DNA transfer family protein n=1 Tax=Rhodanobacter sp. Col0626 TaxID=3415679 RepID=UPI003CFB23BA